MLLDNLFSMLGGTGTAFALLGVLTVVGAVPAGAVFCPRDVLARRLAR